MYSLLWEQHGHLLELEMATYVSKLGILASHLVVWGCPRLVGMVNCP